MKEQRQDKDIRCGHCHKKLAQGEYLTLSIKCPRCRTINQFSAEHATPERHGTPVSNRTSHARPHPTSP